MSSTTTAAPKPNKKQQSAVEVESAAAASTPRAKANAKGGGRLQKQRTAPPRSPERAKKDAQALIDKHKDTIQLPESWCHSKEPHLPADVLRLVETQLVVWTERDRVSPVELLVADAILFAGMFGFFPRGTDHWPLKQSLPFWPCCVDQMTSLPWKRLLDLCAVASVSSDAERFKNMADDVLKPKFVWSVLRGYRSVDNHPRDQSLVIFFECCRKVSQLVQSTFVVFRQRLVLKHAEALLLEVPLARRDEARIVSDALQAFRVQLENTQQQQHQWVPCSNEFDGDADVGEDANSRPSAPSIQQQQQPRTNVELTVDNMMQLKPEWYELYPASSGRGETLALAALEPIQISMTAFAKEQLHTSPITLKRMKDAVQLIRKWDDEIAQLRIDRAATSKTAESTTGAPAPSPKERKLKLLTEGWEAQNPKSTKSCLAASCVNPTHSIRSSGASASTSASSSSSGAVCLECLYPGGRIICLGCLSVVEKQNLFTDEKMTMIRCRECDKKKRPTALYCKHECKPPEGHCLLCIRLARRAYPKNLLDDEGKRKNKTARGEAPSKRPRASATSASSSSSSSSSSSAPSASEQKGKQKNADDGLAPPSPSKRVRFNNVVETAVSNVASTGIQSVSTAATLLADSGMETIADAQRPGAIPMDATIGPLVLELDHSPCFDNVL